VIWLAWRQQRALVLALAAYALLGVATMAFLRSEMLADVADDDLWPCVADSVSPECRHLLADAPGALSFSRLPFSRALDAARLALPGYAALAGVFLGAPAVAREWERRTHLLALTQSASPRRWFAAKVSVVAGPAALGAVVLGVTYVWWTSALGDLAGARLRLVTGPFEAQPLALLGYTLFAVALGLVAGLVVRRTVPAMASTLVVWSGVVLAVRWFVRPHYLPPVVFSTRYDEEAPARAVDPNPWVFEAGHLDRNGDFLSFTAARSMAPSCNTHLNTGRRLECLTDHGVVGSAVKLHPGDRFWLFQSIEAALFTALAAALVVSAAWWLRKRFR